MPQIAAELAEPISISGSNTDADNQPIQILALTNRQQQTNNNNNNK
jgi:hypothetical protein